jgi:hypothetical protein
MIDTCDFEGRPGFAGPSPSAGGLGSPSRPPSTRTDFEGRPGFAGASPSAGGLGGPIEAPHLNEC